MSCKIEKKLLARCDIVLTTTMYKLYNIVHNMDKSTPKPNELGVFTWRFSSICTVFILWTRTF